jgi:dihydroxyacetone kinase
LTNCDAIVDSMLETLIGSNNNNSNDKRYAVLLNNLGGVSQLEMSIVLQRLLQLPFGAKIELLLNGTLMSSLDMRGFSISLLELNNNDDDDQQLFSEALLSPVPTIANWPRVVQFDQPPTTQLVCSFVFGHLSVHKITPQ